MNLGPVFFAQPLALLGLLALPIILWLLRATPPEPKRVSLPSIALLDDIKQIEETPAKTPWWILALRFAAAALAIIGFSQPILHPSQKMTPQSQSTLFVVDDGWTSAGKWENIKKTIQSVSGDVLDAGGDVHLAFTTPQTKKLEIDKTFGAESLRKQLQIIRPSPWLPDYQKALTHIQNTEYKPDKIVWLSDGLQHEGSDKFVDYLENQPAVEVYLFSPSSAFAISQASTSSNGASVTLSRLNTENTQEIRVIAENNRGQSLASSIAVFPVGRTNTVAEFAIPSAVLNQVSRFRILGASSAGQVWLWDDTSIMPSVALADPTPSDQPLLEEYYYIRKALTNNAQIMEGSLKEMIARSPDAIILGDRALTGNANLDELENWIKDGGAFIRFAGPKIAASENHLLTPSPLRSATRALGGALAWEKPQPIAPFPKDKGFAEIKTPAEKVLVRRQVLAQPSSDLLANTWARLQDGTPLVTARPLGRGIIILFHVTATPEWSDLPYDGAFVQMLHRATASGNGNRNEFSDTSGSLSPFRILDAYGILNTPSGELKPLPIDAFSAAIPSFQSPPGLYQGPQGSRALNAGMFATEALKALPANAVVFDDASLQTRRGLEGMFLMGALVCLFVDLFVSLLISGRFRNFSSTAAIIVSLCVLGPNLMPSKAFAQSNNNQVSTISQKQKEAALQMRFAYVETSDASLNLQLEAGLRGLNTELFRRTSVEPAAPHAVKLGEDALDLYPMLYFAPPRNAEALPADQIEALNVYLRSGGSLVIDTRDAVPGQQASKSLKGIMQGLDVPPLLPTPNDHVLTRSFYLLDSFPGRLSAGRVWIESANSTNATAKGDRVSRIYIGASDWIGAWAIDEQKRPLNSMVGQETQREKAYRFGINLVMCILTGNYKEDQVHIPALLERLDQEHANDPENSSRPLRELRRSSPPQNLDDFFNQKRRQRDQQEQDSSK